MEKKRASFSGSIGFIISSAASAVGLGNLWRFPYLAAKDGGGLFIVIYFLLLITFGFTLLMTEVSIGRKTRQSALSAYGTLHKPSKWIGVGASIVPFIIMTYYCVIGGWILKYFFTFVTGGGSLAADDSFFSSFISGTMPPVIYDLVFLAVNVIVVFRGVNDGIEKLSRLLMPLLLILMIGICVFSITLESDGRSGLDGLKIFLIPDISGMTVDSFSKTVFDAMGQLFFSISIAMGIMVTYGSYFDDKSNLLSSVSMIEVFDTVVSFLAGIMIIPAVYVFMGREGMESSGPGLMFIVLPKVFANLGKMGTVIGAAFFLMAFFAAFTSSVSILETIVASAIDSFGWTRKKALALETSAVAVISIIICLGYNLLYFEAPMPDGSKGQILDIMDFISNHVMMPIIAIATCIVVGWIIKPQTIIDEATKNGERFLRRPLYYAMIKYIVPVLLTVLLIGAFI